MICNFRICRHMVFVLPFALLSGPQQCLWWAVRVCVWGDGREPRACRSAFDGKFCRRDECRAPHRHRSFANGTRRLVPRKKQAFSLHRALLQVNLSRQNPNQNGCRVSIPCASVHTPESVQETETDVELSLPSTSSSGTHSLGCVSPRGGSVALGDLPPTGGA